MQQGRGGGGYGSFEVVQQQFMQAGISVPEAHHRVFSVAHSHGDELLCTVPAAFRPQQQKPPPPPPLPPPAPAPAPPQQVDQGQDQDHHAQFQHSQSDYQLLPSDHHPQQQQQQEVQRYQQTVGQILELGTVSPELHSPPTVLAAHDPFHQAHQIVIATRESGLGDDDDNGEDGEKGRGGNRWPRQETLALIKIRTELNASFKDTAVKGPLWEEVSRKLGELGYDRNAKKCKEKFENVHKYYKKTKSRGAARQDGKHYRFFSELEALFGGLREESRDLQAMAAAGSQKQQQPVDDPVAGDVKPAFSDFEDDHHSNNRKRKLSAETRPEMASSLEHLLKNLIERQEAMHKRFLERVDRRERERLAREEEWRREQMARMDRDMKLHDEERSLAATRDAALVAFLQKLTGKSVQFPPPPPPPPPPTTAHPSLTPKPQTLRSDQDASDPDHRRWPKAEVMALIRLRTAMEERFQEPGSKAALWEDIAKGMSRDLGYHRNSKRCKEKWENINKYFRKTKESNRKRPENAKTCPYFHQLDTLYGTGALNPPTPVTAKITSKPDQDPAPPDRPPAGMMNMLLTLPDDHDQICSQEVNASSELQPCQEDASDQISLHTQNQIQDERDLI